MAIQNSCAIVAFYAIFLSAPAFAADAIPITGWLNFTSVENSIKDCSDNKTIKIFQSDQILRDLVDDAGKKGLLVKIEGGSVVYARIEGRIINNAAYCPYFGNRKGCMTIIKVTSLSDPKKTNPCP